VSRLLNEWSAFSAGWTTSSAGKRSPAPQVGKRRVRVAANTRHRRSANVEYVERRTPGTAGRQTSSTWSGEHQAPQVSKRRARGAANTRHRRSANVEHVERRTPGIAGRQTSSTWSGEHQAPQVGKRRRTPNTADRQTSANTRRRTPVTTGTAAANIELRSRALGRRTSRTPPARGVPASAQVGGARAQPRPCCHKQGAVAFRGRASSPPRVGCILRPRS
jgi:hypothetical protein